ncbi:MAG: hypothetical protein FLDDKLPJ_01792 [Phycisphaerae bacterium]|nr:hypothetical protein [Phycisphaerae bacterium]
MSVASVGVLKERPRRVRRALSAVPRAFRAVINLSPLGRTNVGAVALHVVAEGVRMKIALVFLGLLAMIVLALPFSIKGDGSLTGAVQSYLSFSLSFTGFFLGVLTIFLSRSISDELVHRQSFLLFSKPLARWQYIVGKWAGMTIFNFVFLAFSFLCIYGMMHVILRTKPPVEDSYTSGLTPTSKVDIERLAERKALIGDGTEPTQSADRLRLFTDVLTARHSTMFKVPDFTAVAEEEFEQRLREGFYDAATEPVDRAKEIERLKGKHEARWRIIPVFGQRVFEFENILCDRSPGNFIQLRYRAELYDYPPDEIFRSMWVVGDAGKGATQYVMLPRHIVGRFHTIKVPADCVAPDGTLSVLFSNVNPYADPNWFETPEPMFYNTLEITRDGVKCLFTVGSFEGNLLRLFVLMLCKLMFLSAIGVLMTSVFSYPVACLAAFVLYALAGLRSFMHESLEQFDKYDEPVTATMSAFFNAISSGEGGKASESFQTLAAEFISGGLRLIFKVVPDFSYFDGVETLVNGENVSLVWVLQGVGELVVLQTACILGLSILLFYRREVSETSF